MLARPVRLAVSALLLASGSLAGFFLWTLEERTQLAMATAANASARLALISDTIAGIGMAQQSYVAPGQLDEPWFERTSALISSLAHELKQLRASLRSPAAGGILQKVADSIRAFTAADLRARQNLQIGQDLMASDVISSDGRNLLDAMMASLRELQAAEQAHLTTSLDDIARQRSLALGLVVALWMAALFSLAVLGGRARGTAESTKPESTETARFDSVVDSRSPTAPSKDVDLAAAASVCTDLSRITTTAQLPGLLGRAAGVLDASGVILWISAGEQLFPVMGHGYDAETLARFGPIARGAENAAATAWRTGQLTVVPSSVSGGGGAIVAPLFGLHSCIGVLSAEVRHGEQTPAVQAVATIIAAQLSTVVPAWPAGSLSPAEGPAAEARSA